MIDSAKLWIKYRSEDSKVISTVEDAILPETKIRRRCQLTVSKVKNDDSSGNEQELCLLFESHDLASLRASLNTDLRLVSSVIRTLNTVEERNQL